MPFEDTSFDVHHLPLTYEKLTGRGEYLKQTLSCFVTWRTALTEPHCMQAFKFDIVVTLTMFIPIIVINLDSRGKKCKSYG